jgi:hypothetical protein
MNRDADFYLFLKNQNVAFKIHRAGGGHMTVKLKGKTSQFPIYGMDHELGPELIKKIKKDLGLT